MNSVYIARVANPPQLAGNIPPSLIIIVREQRVGVDLEKLQAEEAKDKELVALHKKQEEEDKRAAAEEKKRKERQATELAQLQKRNNVKSIVLETKQARHAIEMSQMAGKKRAGKQAARRKPAVAQDDSNSSSDNDSCRPVCTELRS